MKQFDVAVKKLDEVYMKVYCSDAILEELREYFTFEPINQEYNPRKRKQKWDGKIRLIDKRYKKLYVGLFEHLKIFCSDRKYNLISLDDDLNTSDNFSKYIAEKFCELLNLSDGKNDITVNNHQLKAFIHVMRNRRALLLSPTSSGKSLLAYLIVRQLISYKRLRGLIIVPTTGLCHQLYSDFEDYSKNNGWKVEKKVSLIMEGYDKNPNTELVIGTWQSLVNSSTNFLSSFDFVICDEAHLATANSIKHILHNCTKAKYRIALTGTIKDSETHKVVLEGLFGPINNVIKTKELMDLDIVSKLKINCIVLKYPEVIAKEIKNKKSYYEEIQFLIGSESRNKFIKNLSVSLEGNTLILYKYVDKHGKILYNMIKNTEKLKGKNVYFISGETDTDIRENIRKVLESENNAILIASAGTTSTGWNVKNLHNLILAFPSKSKITILQSIGRALRKSQNKDYATLYDISDDLSVENHMNYTIKHFVSRVKLYEREQFPYKIYKVGVADG